MGVLSLQTSEIETHPLWANSTKYYFLQLLENAVAHTRPSQLIFIDF